MLRTHGEGDRRRVGVETGVGANLGSGRSWVALYLSYGNS